MTSDVARGHRAGSSQGASRLSHHQRWSQLPWILRLYFLSWLILLGGGASALLLRMPQSDLHFSSALSGAVLSGELAAVAATLAWGARARLFTPSRRWLLTLSLFTAGVVFATCCGAGIVLAEKWGYPPVAMTLTTVGGLCLSLGGMLAVAGLIVVGSGLERVLRDLRPGT